MPLNLKIFKFDSFPIQFPRMDRCSKIELEFFNWTKIKRVACGTENCVNGDSSSAVLNRKRHLHAMPISFSLQTFVFRDDDLSRYTP